MIIIPYQGSIYNLPYYDTSYNREQVAEWEKTYGEDNQKQDKRSVLERLKNPLKKMTDYQQQSAVKIFLRKHFNQFFLSCSYYVTI